MTTILGVYESAGKMTSPKNCIGKGAIVTSGRTCRIMSLMVDGPIQESP